MWGTRLSTQLARARDSQLGARGLACPDPAQRTPPSLPGFDPSRVNFRNNRPTRERTSVNFYLLTRAANESGPKA